jgi:hypothetical protein
MQKRVASAIGVIVLAVASACAGYVAGHHGPSAKVAQCQNELRIVNKAFAQVNEQPNLLIGFSRKSDCLD